MSEGEAITVLRAAGWALVQPPAPFRAVSVAEAAERLGCSQDWVRAHLAEFRGAFRLGTAIRIPEEDIPRVARSRRVFAGGTG
jgi:excisionase family DNA binding protein